MWALRQLSLSALPYGWRGGERVGIFVDTDSRVRTETVKNSAKVQGNNARAARTGQEGQLYVICAVLYTFCAYHIFFSSLGGLSPTGGRRRDLAMTPQQMARNRVVTHSIMPSKGPHCQCSYTLLAFPSVTMFVLIISQLMSVCRSPASRPRR